MNYFYSSQYSDSSIPSPPSSGSFSSLSVSPGAPQGYYPSSSSYDYSNSYSSGVHSYGSSQGNPSRSSSVSPNLGTSSRNYPAMNWKARLEASRGFDLEDDMEFCPLVCYPTTAAMGVAPNPYAASDFYAAGGVVGIGASSASSPLGSPSHQHSNPFIASTSPNSPTHTNMFSHSTITYYPNNHSSPRPVSAHKVRKGIQIVDPSTGLKVGSHSLTPAGLAKPVKV